MNEIYDMDLDNCGVTTEYAVASYSILFAGQTTSVVLPSSAITTNVLVLDADTAEWVFAATKKLEALGRLKENWDSYGGLPLSRNAKRITFDALGWLRTQDLPVPAVVLGSSGTVHLEWTSKGKTLELGFGERGVDEYLKVDQNGQVEEIEDAHFSNDEAKEKLESLAAWFRSS